MQSLDGLLEPWSRAQGGGGGVKLPLNLLSGAAGRRLGGAAARAPGDPAQDATRPSADSLEVDE